MIYTTIWLPIKDYPNYEISICGQVRNVKTNKILKPGKCNGYFLVSLSQNSKSKNFRVHRLVAEHFLPNIDNKKCVDHIDNNRTNNTISNLRWSTFQENNFNQSLSSRNTSGVKGVTWHKRRLMWEAQIHLNNKKVYLGYYSSIEEASEARRQMSNKLFGEFLNSCEK